MLVPGTLIGDRYALVERLSEGFTAEVWLAKDGSADNALVALKIARQCDTLPVRRRLRSYFEHESVFLHENETPSLPQWIDYGIWKGDGPCRERPFIAMEYLRGMTLASYMRHHLRRPTNEVMELFFALLQRVGFLHDEALIHRDLKPGNIILVPTDTNGFEIKIVDLGFARKRRRGVDIEGFQGSCGYSSPEQLVGHIPTRAQDVFSLGVILYELLSGLHPTGRTLNEQIPELWMKDEQLISLQWFRQDLSAEFVQVVERGFHRDPYRRHPSTDAFAAALRSVWPG